MSQCVLPYCNSLHPRSARHNAGQRRSYVRQRQLAIQDTNLRVAQIIASLAIGGAERHLVNLLNAMNCDFKSVICIGEPAPGVTFEGDLDDDIERHTVRIRQRSALLGVSRLAKLLRRLEIDVVHTHMYGSSLYGALAVRLAGTPVFVTTEHGENPWKSRVERWIERRVISSAADCRFCVSPRILEIRRDVDGIPADKLRLTVNGTVLPQLPPQRAANEVPRIGAVGRLIPAKDYSVLLHAAADLRQRGYDFQLEIAGDGPERPMMSELISNLGLQDSVSMLGLITDVGALYRRCDFCVSSSIREGLPVALLEAMAHGLPVVATDVGASQKLFNTAKVGWLFRQAIRSNSPMLWRN